MDPAEPTKPQMLTMDAAAFDSDTLRFEGLRGDRSAHLDRSALEAGLADLLRAPTEVGFVDLLVARGPAGERHLPDEVELTVAGGMPGDRWATEPRYGPEYQLATTRTDVAALIANGQPLELHGDNLFVSLDLSAENLPAGTVLRAGSVVLRVTPKAHNGCKKWVQRFGLDAMQLNLAPDYRSLNIRGIYLQVVEPGRLGVGDRIVVSERPGRD